jgi:exopolysaccharide biosynthesis polyprenyl glycosylphosphotransferase
VLYLAVTDFLILFGVFGVTLRLRFMPRIDIIDVPQLHLIPSASFFLVYSLLALVLFNEFRLYQRRTWLTPAMHLLILLKAMAVALLVYMVLQYLTKSRIIVESRLVAAAWATASFLLLAFNRLLLFPALWHWATRSHMERRVAVIGASETGRTFARRMRNEASRSGLDVVGFLSKLEPAGKEIEGVPCLGTWLEISELAAQHHLEGAVVTAENVTHQELMDIAEDCVRLFGWVDIHCSRAECLTLNLDPDTHLDIPFVRLRGLPTGPFVLAGKRAVDLVGSIAGLALLFPLMLVTAVAIKLTSPGPALYISERVGRGGRPFRFYKFRSMRVGSDRDGTRSAAILRHIKDDEPIQKAVNRANVTRVGAFIRKWAIDEIPQLFNVLKGDMSLVGPRPVPRADYEAEDPWQKKRFDIKPGCTGLWKLFASRDHIPFSHTALYDIYYARNMSLAMDVYILLGTVRVVLTGRADV